jgi:3-dehydroquinate synthase
MPTLTVHLPGRAYDLVIDSGAITTCGSIVRRVAPHARAFVVIDENIAAAHGAAALTSLKAAGFEISHATVRADEARKSLDTASRLYDAMLRHRVERSTPVIAVGGGVIGDVAGFAAATFLRGVPLVHVPTTLLAMVDASIGGKTAVNLPLPAGGLGKNLVGSFWQPRAIVADPRSLATLDARDLRCGIAECIKHALIGDATLLDFLRRNRDAIVALDDTTLISLIERSAAIKIGIVQRDETESGERALLNLGHTFAHVIEPIESLDLRHGEAVAIGLIAAAHIARRTDRLTEAQERAIVEVVRAYGLPDRIARPIDHRPLLEAMRYDKKASGDRVRLVLPRGIGAAELAADTPSALVIDALRTVGCT